MIPPHEQRREQQEKDHRASLLRVEQPASPANTEALPTLRQKFDLIMAEMHERWDTDQDMRVGKMIIALRGRAPRYMAEIDAFLAALDQIGSGNQDPSATASASPHRSESAEDCTREFCRTTLDLWREQDQLLQDIGNELGVEQPEQIIPVIQAELALHDDLVSALKEIERHHVLLNGQKGRGEEFSTTLRIVRQALAKVEHT